MYIFFNQYHISKNMITISLPLSQNDAELYILPHEGIFYLYIIVNQRVEVKYFAL